MTFSIIGAGLVGSLLSIYLKKLGYSVEVYEKRDDPRISNMVSGRSINLALSDRGWLSLAEIGLVDIIKDISIPMFGRKIHHLDGALSFYNYGEANEAIYSISRSKLNKILVEEASKLGVSFFYNHKCIDVNIKEKEIVFDHLSSTTKRYECLIGTDGAFSEIRSILSKTERFNLNQWYLNHGYKELSIPANDDKTHKLDKNALHIWPRGQFMLIALPNLDGSFTCTLFLPFDGEISFASIKSENDLNSFFAQNFPDVMSLFPQLNKEFFGNPTSSLINVSCFPWSFQDNVLLMGDAARSIVPFFGQGMNAGFEDVRIFCSLLTKNKSDLKSLFKSFQNERKVDSDAIAEISLNNFIEMSEKVNDPKFQLKKKLDERIHSLMPEKWTTQYSLVTFSPNISYSKALEISSQNNIILEKILNDHNWDHSIEKLTKEDVLKYLL